MSNDPLGPWDHDFPFVKEIGCAYTFLGFVVFLVISLLVWRGISH